ncbi:Exportin-4, partial [Pseudolycoriella hygida]
MNVSIADLENAANLFMGAPGDTNAEQRRAAETVIMNFRKTKSPYQLCQEVLEKTQVDILRFEAADMIKQAIVVEWESLEEQYKLSLRQYLLNYILNRNVPPFVREKILQCVAIMIKRSGILDDGVERGFILDEAQKMISSGDTSQQYLACRIIYNIMQEYSTIIKSVSDDTGLTFSEHFKAKKQFEFVDLRKIFVMIFEALIAIMKEFDVTNPSHVHLLLEYFTIQEQILMWGYVSTLLSKRLVGIFETINKTDQCPSLRLTYNWERIILDPRVVEVFFGIYWKVRDIPQIQPKSLTCIVQLSTLNGPVLNNQESKLKYVTNFLTHFLQLTSSVQIRSNEANGFATVLRRILLYNLPNIFKDISDELRTLLLQQMFYLACNFVEASIYEDK